MRSSALWILALGACAPATPDAVTITLTNLADDTTYTLSSGQPLEIGLAPGLIAQVSDASVVFEPGQAASPELEQLAEQGDPTTLKAALDNDDAVSHVSFFGDAGAADYAEAAVTPGLSARRTLDVVEGEVVVLAMMLGASNDTFVGTPAGGLDLAALDLRDPVDVTAQVAWWDAGTEVNQPLGEGPDQPGSSEPGAGQAEEGVVSAGGEADWPAVDEVVEVIVEAAEDNG